MLNQGTTEEILDSGRHRGLQGSPSPGSSELLPRNDESLDLTRFHLPPFHPSKGNAWKYALALLQRLAVIGVDRKCFPFISNSISCHMNVTYLTYLHENVESQSNCLPVLRRALSSGFATFQATAEPSCYGTPADASTAEVQPLQPSTKTLSSVHWHELMVDTWI